MAGICMYSVEDTEIQIYLFHFIVFSSPWKVTAQFQRGAKGSRTLKLHFLISKEVEGGRERVSKQNAFHGEGGGVWIFPGTTQ